MIISYIILRNVEGKKKKKSLFFLLENSRPLSPWGSPDLSTCLEIDSLRVTEGGPMNRPWGSARLLVSGRWSPSAGAHRTGWCELRDPQAACSQTGAEAATAWSSSGKLSTILCIIFLIRTIPVSK